MREIGKDETSSTLHSNGDNGGTVRKNSETNNKISCVRTVANPESSFESTDGGSQQERDRYAVLPFALQERRCPTPVESYFHDDTVKGSELKSPKLPRIDNMSFASDAVIEWKSVSPSDNAPSFDEQRCETETRREVSNEEPRCDGGDGVRDYSDLSRERTPKSLHFDVMPIGGGGARGRSDYMAFDGDTIIEWERMVPSEGATTQDEQHFDTDSRNTHEDNRHFSSCDGLSSDDDVRDFTFSRVSQGQTPRSLLCEVFSFGRDDLSYEMSQSTFGVMEDTMLTVETESGTFDSAASRNEDRTGSLLKKSAIEATPWSKKSLLCGAASMETGRRQVEDTRLTGVTESGTFDSTLSKGGFQSDASRDNSVSLNLLDGSIENNANAPRSGESRLFTDAGTDGGTLKQEAVAIGGSENRKIAISMSGVSLGMDEIVEDPIGNKASIPWSPKSLLCGAVDVDIGMTNKDAVITEGCERLDNDISRSGTQHDVSHEDMTDGGTLKQEAVAIGGSENRKIAISMSGVSLGTDEIVEDPIGNKASVPWSPKSLLCGAVDVDIGMTNEDAVITEGCERLDNDISRSGTQQDVSHEDMVDVLDDRNLAARVTRSSPRSTLCEGTEADAGVHTDDTIEKRGAQRETCDIGLSRDENAMETRGSPIETFGALISRNRSQCSGLSTVHSQDENEGCSHPSLKSVHGSGGDTDTAGLVAVDGSNEKADPTECVLVGAKRIENEIDDGVEDEYISPSRVDEIEQTRTVAIHVPISERRDVGVAESKEKVGPTECVQVDSRCVQNHVDDGSVECRDRESTSLGIATSEDTAIDANTVSAILCGAAEPDESESDDATVGENDLDDDEPMHGLKKKAEFRGRLILAGIGRKERRDCAASDASHEIRETAARTTWSPTAILCGTTVVRDSELGDDEIVELHAGLRTTATENDVPCSISEKLPQDAIRSRSHKPPLAAIKVEQKLWEAAVKEANVTKGKAVATDSIQCSPGDVHDIFNDLCFDTNPTRNRPKSLDSLRNRELAIRNPRLELDGVKHVLNRRPLSPMSSPRFSTRESNFNEAFRDLCFVGSAGKLFCPRESLLIETAVRGEDKNAVSQKGGDDTKEDPSDNDEVATVHPFDEEESLSLRVTRVIENRVMENKNVFPSEDLVDLSGNVSLVPVSDTITSRHPVMAAVEAEDVKISVCGAWQLEELKGLMKDLRAWTAQTLPQTLPQMGSASDKRIGSNEPEGSNARQPINKAINKALRSRRKSYSAYKFGRNATTIDAVCDMFFLGSGTIPYDGNTLLGQTIFEGTKLSVSEDAGKRGKESDGIDSLSPVPAGEMGFSFPFDEGFTKRIIEPLQNAKECDEDDSLRVRCMKVDTKASFEAGIFCFSELRTNPALDDHKTYRLPIAVRSDGACLVPISNDMLPLFPVLSALLTEHTAKNPGVSVSAFGMYQRNESHETVTGIKKWLLHGLSAMLGLGTGTKEAKHSDQHSPCNEEKGFSDAKSVSEELIPLYVVSEAINDGHHKAKNAESLATQVCLVSTKGTSIGTCGHFRVTNEWTLEHGEVEAIEGVTGVVLLLAKPGVTSPRSRDDYVYEKVDATEHDVLKSVEPRVGTTCIPGNEDADENDFERPSRIQSGKLSTDSEVEVTEEGVLFSMESEGTGLVCSNDAKACEYERKSRITSADLSSDSNEEEFNELLGVIMSAGPEVIAPLSSDIVEEEHEQQEYPKIKSTITSSDPETSEGHHLSCDHKDGGCQSVGDLQHCSERNESIETDTSIRGIFSLSQTETTLGSIEVEIADQKDSSSEEALLLVPLFYHEVEEEEGEESARAYITTAEGRHIPAEASLRGAIETPTSIIENEAIAAGQGEGGLESIEIEVTERGFLVSVDSEALSSDEFEEYEREEALRTGSDRRHTTSDVSSNAHQVKFQVGIFDFGTIAADSMLECAQLVDRQHQLMPVVPENKRVLIRVSKEHLPLYAVLEALLAAHQTQNNGASCGAFQSLEEMLAMRQFRAWFCVNTFSPR